MTQMLRNTDLKRFFYLQNFHSFKIMDLKIYLLFFIVSFTNKTKLPITKILLNLCCEASVSSVFHKLYPISPTPKSPHN
jgi:hypothetical protein